MSYISKIDLSTAPQEVRAAVDNHLAQGYQLTNEKLTLLHNVTACLLYTSDAADE